MKQRDIREILLEDKQTIRRMANKYTMILRDIRQGLENKSCFSPVVEPNRIDLLEGSLESMYNIFDSIYQEATKEDKPKTELSETIELMVSDNHIDRLKAEYLQAEIRRNKLKDIIDKYYKNELEFTPHTPIGTLQRQYEALSDYAEILLERLSIEDNI